MIRKGMTKVKKVKLGRKGQVVIPKEVREALGLREGDMLLVGCLLYTSPSPRDRG